jgi:hypothetical protein
MHVRHRWLLATALGSVIFAVTYVAAASLGISGGNLASGAALVESCDPDGVTTAFSAPAFDGTDFMVERVTVRGIDRACVGHDFVVMLADGSAVQLAEGRLLGVTSGAFGGSADALTLEFDFTASRIRSDQVQTIFVSIL